MRTNIKTPDQRLRVFVSSTLTELAAERNVVKEAVLTLNLIPVMFEMGARPYPPRDLYSAYLQQSHIFIGIYWQQYGWLAPDMNISGIEDELELARHLPRLLYIKEPAPERSDDLKRLISKIEQSGVSYKIFNTNSELKSLIINDLAVLFTERFESSAAHSNSAVESDVLNEEFPVPSLPVIGREAVIQFNFDLLQKPLTRLLTLTGTGGMGKTTVALELIRRVKNTALRQVCFVPLSSVERVEDVPTAILRKAFPAATGAVPALKLLIDLLKNKEALLVLDNFEHLIEARRTVSELLRHCPGLQIMVTSRELLHITGEIECALQPLGLCPVDKDLEDLEEIPASVELFLQRTRNIHPTFELNKENYDAIREMCFLLDGIPLALELAAARTRLLSPSQIMNLLKKSLDILKSGNHDMPDRHQTLKATVDWSFALLRPEEQHSICMLSVFSGGGTLEAASFIGSKNEFEGGIWAFPRKGFYKSESIENVLNENVSEFDFLESAESLLSKSLIYTSVNQHGLLRINFFQTIRHYCQEKLKECGVEKTAFQKHFLYYLYLAESTWPKLRSKDAEASYVILDNDIFNIESALHWSLHNEPILGLRLAIAMAEYWDTRGRFEDTRNWIMKLKQASSKDENDHFEIFCIANLELSRTLFRLSEFDKAWDFAVECFSEAQKRDNKYFMTDALVLQSLINVFAHRNENKDTIVEQAISNARSLNYKMALLDCIQFKAADKIFGGSTTEGIQLAEESLLLAQEYMAIRWQAIAHVFLGFGYLSVGSIDTSRENFIKALVCAQNLSDQLLPVYSMLGLSQIALVIQEFETACRYLGTIDAALGKPGASFVPIVKTMYDATLEQLKTINFEHQNQLLDEGRKIKFNAAIQMALDDTGSEETSRLRANQDPQADSVTAL